MYWDTTNTLPDRFAWLIDGLCKAIGADAHKRRIEAALAWAIWTRVRLLGARLISLAERARERRLPVRPAPRPVDGPRAPRSAQSKCRAAASLPREFGWIRRLLPATAEYAGALRYLLRDPDVAALVEKAPQAGRILRPLCHLLGVKAPDFLRSGIRDGAVSDAAEVKDTSSQPSPQSGEPLAVEVQPQPSTPAALAAGQVTAPVPRPRHLRPGGLYWDGSRWQWS